MATSHQTTKRVFRNDLAYNRLQEVLVYEPETGLFRWRITRHKCYAGAIAGSSMRGYLLVKIDYKQYRLHRLAWLYMTGRWPKGQIDHANRDRSDNRWRNLREATQSQQNANSRIRHRGNTSGFKGVSFDSVNGKWIAQIVVDGVHYWLGRHANIKDAVRAYRMAAKQKFGKFARTT